MSGSSSTVTGIISTGTTSNSSSSHHPHVSSASITPAPLATTTTTTAFAQHLQQSMSMEEMRSLHRQAWSEAEAKRTELRLVLSSRYRELVATSDTVTRMTQRAEELHRLLHNIPSMMEQLSSTSSTVKQQQQQQEEEKQEKEEADATNTTLQSQQQRQLQQLLRSMYRALDETQVYSATIQYQRIQQLLFSSSSMLLSTATKSMIHYQIQSIPSQIVRRALHTILGQPAATAVTTTTTTNENDRVDDENYYYDQHSILQPSVSALLALYLLRPQNDETNVPATGIVENEESTMMMRLERLVTTYYQCKTTLITSLLNQLSSSSSSSTSSEPDGNIQQSEHILIQIVQILQHDIIVHPYLMLLSPSLHNHHHHHHPKSLYHHIPVLQSPSSSTTQRLQEMIQTKCSKFLVTHLPLIRQKVKSILVTIAGTTASALGQIRQSIYDQTDGVDALRRLNMNTWNQAVDTMIDRRLLLTVTDAILGPETTATAPSNQPSYNRFSLWGALFSNTFSSLVHSILSTSFESVHTKVISSLQELLQAAPSMEHILPHEAYQNTYQIVTELDRSLHKVRMDAYELLVHAEERIESERRLRQSLYVQTCEIIGRLLCELRRMVTTVPNTVTSHSMMDVSTSSRRNMTPEMDATKELIIGRLCYVLKFRLSSLRTLLAPDSSPANHNPTTGTAATATTTVTGMISLIDVQSAFDLADDDEDGLITLDDAMDVADSAFAGTPFHGSNMIRETLLSSSSSNANTVGAVQSRGGDHDPSTTTESSLWNSSSSSTKNTTVTFNELTLITARGLRHDADGGGALRVVQSSLDHIILICFQYWSNLSVRGGIQTFQTTYHDFMECATTVPDDEWQRMSGLGGNSHDVACRGVSPCVAAYILSIGSILNSNIAPSDCLSPVSNPGQAPALGITTSMSNKTNVMIPTFMEMIRWSLLDESLYLVSSTLHGMLVNNTSGLTHCGLSALIQCYVDINFIKSCYVDRNQNGFITFDEKLNHRRAESIQNLDTILHRQIEPLILSHKDNLQGEETMKKVSMICAASQERIFETSDLFVKSLFGPQPISTESLLSDNTILSSIMSEPMFPLPLPSSRRFVLLPVPVDRSFADIQRLQNMYGKEESSSSAAMDGRSTNATSDSYSSSNVISGGLGFLSSMLKTKK